MLCQEPNFKKLLINMINNLGSCSTLTVFLGSFCIESIKIEEGKALKYVKANNVLPEEMIRAIQEYIDGEFLYIPRKIGKQKSWGEKSGTKDMLDNRNNEIFQRYSKGITVKKLALMYYLSEQSIRRIIREQNRMRS